MKVILLRDVAGVGQKEDIKDLKGGFARNFLLPQNLAELATPEKIKALQTARAGREQKRTEHKSEVERELEKISGSEIVFEAKANETGRLFRGIGAKEISQKLGELGFKAIEPEWILPENSLKEVGEHQIEIKPPSGKGVKARVVIKPTPR
ncbi:MAG: 50S ribosomal protein L9 [bacterium]|nr:50S ribosomal protein L9 [bacterium]